MAELIHLANLNGKLVLKLMKEGPKEYFWTLDDKPLDFKAATVAEAFALARKHFTVENFSPLNCGTLFTLPERDEHGQPALYSQMVKSQKSMSGVYFDEALGHSCIVRDIPSNVRKMVK